MVVVAFGSVVVVIVMVMEVVIVAVMDIVVVVVTVSVALAKVANKAAAKTAIAREMAISAVVLGRSSRSLWAASRCKTATAHTQALKSSTSSAFPKTASSTPRGRISEVFRAVVNHAQDSRNAGALL